MKVEKRKFKGGYRFKNFDGQITDKIDAIDIPERVVIPLKQGFGNEVPFISKIGYTVQAGQIIGRDDTSVSSPVHATANGVVEKVVTIEVFGCEVQAVVIKSNGTKTWRVLDGATENWEELPTDKIEEILYLSGVTALDKEGIPTKFNSSVITPSDVENIIVHAVGSEVFNLSLSVLLGGERVHNFVEGLKILHKVMPNAKVHLAIGNNEKEWLTTFSKILDGIDWLRLYALEPKYPQGYDEVLIPTILKREFPHGYCSANIGATVLSVQAVLHVYDAVVEGKPLIERIIGFGGAGFKENVHAKVRIGTSLDFILKNRIKDDLEVRYILNSALTGDTITNLSYPLDKSYRMLLALHEDRKRYFIPFMNPGFNRDSYSRTFLSYITTKRAETNVHGEERPHVSCGFCEEVCPVRIIPHLIYSHVERGFIEDRLIDFGIYKCIDCNLCNYVCVSKIPIAQYIKEGKDKLIEEGLEPPLPDYDMKGVEEYLSIREKPVQAKDEEDETS
ncbi:hypothetical protein JXI42_07450 [bacterium]|nr:hypothetical protein [bacterium]